MWYKGPHECCARLSGHSSRIGHNCSHLRTFLFTPSVRVTIHDHASGAPRVRSCWWSHSGPLRSSLANRHARAQLSRCQWPPELHERTRHFDRTEAPLDRTLCLAVMCTREHMRRMHVRGNDHRCACGDLCIGVSRMQRARLPELACQNNALSLKQHTHGRSCGRLNQVPTTPPMHPLEPPTTRDDHESPGEARKVKHRKDLKIQYFTLTHLKLVLGHPTLKNRFRCCSGDT